MRRRAGAAGGSCACAYRAKNPDTLHGHETLRKSALERHDTLVFTHTFPRRARIEFQGTKNGASQHEVVGVPEVHVVGANSYLLI